MAGKVTRSLEERFWEKVDWSADGCWLWNACLDGHGYGSFTPSTGRKITAHRMSWILTQGPLDGKFVLHHCDNPLCVRPDHLFLGTQTDNIADMVRKGRQSIGERCNHKLTAEQVREIRRSRNHAEIIGKRFGINKRHVFRIKAGDRWKHL